MSSIQRFQLAMAAMFEQPVCNSAAPPFEQGHQVAFGDGFRFGIPANPDQYRMGDAYRVGVWYDYSIKGRPYARFIGYFASTDPLIQAGKLELLVNQQALPNPHHPIKEKWLKVYGVDPESLSSLIEQRKMETSEGWKPTTAAKYHAVKVLNELMQHDPEALKQLLALRVLVKDWILDHPTLIPGRAKEDFPKLRPEQLAETPNTLGLIGLINGLLCWPEQGEDFERVAGEVHKLTGEIHSFFVSYGPYTSAPEPQAA